MLDGWIGTKEQLLLFSSVFLNMTLPAFLPEDSSVSLATFLVGRSVIVKFVRSKRQPRYGAVGL